MAALDRRAVLALLGAAPAALLQQGCGFAPVLARRGDGGGAAEALAAIRVGPIGSGDTRAVGHVLRNALIERFAAAGRRPARYDLAVALTRTSAPLQIQTTDVATRYNLVLRAALVLTDATTGATVHRASVRSVASYDVVRSRYATLTADRKAAADAARDLSRAIAGLLAARFAEDGGE